MNDAQQLAATAVFKLGEAIELLARASAAAKLQRLVDFDARAVSIATTQAETAEMWAQRAAQS